MSKASRLVMAVSAIIATETVANAALLINGNFNTDADANSSPDGWQSWSYQTSGAAWATYQPGSSSYNEDGTPFVNAGSTWNGGGGWYQIAAATPGATYTLSVDASTETWDNSISYMRLIFLDSTNTVVSETDKTVANYEKLTTWGTYTISDITAPSTATQVKVEFASYGGTSNFDNAVLTAVPEPASLGLLAIGAVGLLRRRR